MKPILWRNGSWSKTRFCRMHGLLFEALLSSLKRARYDRPFDSFRPSLNAPQKDLQNGVKWPIFRRFYCAFAFDKWGRDGVKFFLRKRAKKLLARLPC